MTNNLFCRSEFIKQKENSNNMKEKEVLDFCRVKKIFDRGFGFLTSLYHEENIFFHFSKIKDLEKRELLNNMKRGVVIVYYTSKLNNGKRKVDKIWLDISNVPQNMLPEFINRLIFELNDGKTNPFEVIAVLNQLRGINKLTKQNYIDIVSSKRILKNPSILLKLISEKEKYLYEKLTILLEELKDKNLSVLKQKKGLINLINLISS